VGRARFCLLAAAAVLFCFVEELSPAYPQENPVAIAAVHGLDAPRKFENGFQIFWRSTSVAGDPQPGETDPEAKIRIFEGPQRELVVCRLASSIRSFDPAFSGVSIYDVSARRPGFIAVAAVYLRMTGSPVALLLYFDWSGSLSRRVVLRNRPGIQSLEVVSADQVWALNDFGPMDQSRFVFTAFDRNGAVIKEVVRSHRDWSTDESMSKGGQTSFGVIGDRVWTWLPKSRTFISFNSLDGRAETKSTQFPRVGQSSALYARQAALLPNGQLLMDVGWMRFGKWSSGWFAWSSQSGWREVNSSFRNRYLYAVEGNRVIFTAPREPTGASSTFRSVSIDDLMANISPPNFPR